MTGSNIKRVTLTILAQLSRIIISIGILKSTAVTLQGKKQYLCGVLYLRYGISGGLGWSFSSLSVGLIESVLCRTPKLLCSDQYLTSLLPTGAQVIEIQEVVKNLHRTNADLRQTVEVMWPNYRLRASWLMSALSALF